MSKRSRTARYNKSHQVEIEYNDILKYVALHSNCTKYDLVKNVHTKQDKPIPYSTMVNRIKQLAKWRRLTEIRLGKTRTGLYKKGYRITWRAIWVLADKFELDELMNTIKTHKDLAPIPLEIIEKVIKAGNGSHNLSEIISATEWVRKLEPTDEFLRELILDLTYNQLGNIDIKDDMLFKEFARTVIERVIEVNANNDNFKSKVKENFHNMLEQRKREQIALDIMKDTISKL